MTVPLHGKKAAGRVALVDDSDYDLVSAYRWRMQHRQHAGYDNGPYAIATIERPDGRKSTVLMHTLITGWPETDHENHDGLDNQRQNLRPASRSLNTANQRPRQVGTSRFKGVYLHRGTMKWVAHITPVPGARQYLGLFAAEEDAARAYDAAAVRAFGEYAYLNADHFPGLVGDATE